MIRKLQKVQGRWGRKKEGREVEGECMGNVGKERGRGKIDGRLSDNEGKENLGKWRVEARLL